MENAILSYDIDRLKIIITDPIVLPLTVTTVPKKNNFFIPGTPANDIQAQLGTSQPMWLYAKISHVGGLLVDVGLAFIQSGTVKLEILNPVNGLWDILNSISTEYQDGPHLTALIPSLNGGASIRISMEAFGGNIPDSLIKSLSFIPQ